MRRYGVLLALIFVAVAVPARGLAPALQDPAPLTEAEYWSLVEHSRQIAAGLHNVPDERVRAAFSGLADEWEAVEAVRRADEQVVPVDHSYVVTLLRDQAADPDRIKGVFETMLNAHRRYPEEIFTTADLASLEALARRPEFQWASASQVDNPIERWISDLWDRFNRWLESLFGDSGLVISAPPAQSFLSILAALLLILILFYVARTLLTDFVGDARLLPEAEGGEVLNADTAFSRAMQLSRGGDYRSAVRYLYLSSLLLLDERGLLRYDRSKTNREYLRSVAGEPELAGPLGEVIDVFDNVWYGYHALDEESFRHYSRQVEALKERKS